MNEPRRIVVRSGAPRVVIGSRSGHHVRLAAETVALIAEHRPKSIIGTDGTSVRVDCARTSIRAGGMGVQGPPGPAGSSIPAIAFAYGDAEREVWAPTAPGLLTYVRLIVTTPFDGAGAQLAIGTASDPAAALPPEFSDLSQALEYENTPDLRLAAGEGIRVAITPGAGATTGAGLLLLEFLPD